MTLNLTLESECYTLGWSRPEIPLVGLYGYAAFANCVVEEEQFLKL